MLIRRPRGAAALAVAGLACLCPAPAQAGGGAAAILQDCQDDGRIDGIYSQAAYAKALGSLPTDLDEYSDCRDQIRSAQLRAAARGRAHSTRSTSDQGAPAAPGRSGGGGPPSGGAGPAAHGSPPPARPASPATPPGSASATAAASSTAAAPPVRRATVVPAAAHEAAVSPRLVAGLLVVAALAVGLTGAAAPRYLPRVLRRLR
jgi:hypothetical protein